MRRTALLFFILLIVACKKDEFVPIDVSTTNNLAMSSQWAIITEPYVSYFSESDENSSIETYGRIGDVVEVIGTDIGDNTKLWYKFEGGWLAEDSVQLYSNKLQAEFAAKEVQ